MSQFDVFCCDKHHNQNQSESERGFISSYVPRLQPSLRDFKAETQAETERESTEEYCLLDHILVQGSLNFPDLGTNQRGLSPPTPTSDQENVPQICPQAIPKKIIFQLNVTPPPGVSSCQPRWVITSADRVSIWTPRTFFKGWSPGG